MTDRHRAVRVVRAPVGSPRPEDFAVVELPAPRPGPGQVLFRGLLLSIDPSARRRLPAPGTTPPLGAVAAVGDVVLAGVVPASAGLDGALVGEVLESRHPGFVPGDLVRGGSHWQELHAVDGDRLDRIDPADGTSPAEELGVLGRSGLVGWCGIELVAAVRPGDTVVVSAAGGAVGMVAGQVARDRGARVVGIASGDKVRFVVDELGLDGCVDRAASDVGAELDRLCPDGVDVYLDNVGGPVLDAVFPRLADFGRLVVCGMAGEYNAAESPSGPPLRPVLRKRLRIEGFVVHDHYDRAPEYRAWALPRLRDGRLRYREDVVDGLEQAPAALARLLRGENRGKQLVRLTDERTTA
ncbi:NADP-dependent oxidoreductase [Blastococcus sp. SYSU D00820]